LSITDTLAAVFVVAVHIPIPIIVRAMPAIVVGAGRRRRVGPVTVPVPVPGPVTVTVAWRWRRGVVGPVAMARRRRHLIIDPLLHDATRVAIGISVGAGRCGPAELVADDRPADGTDKGPVAPVSVACDRVSEEGTAQGTDQGAGDLLVMPVPLAGLTGRGEGGGQGHSGGHSQCEKKS